MYERADHQTDLRIYRERVIYVQWDGSGRTLRFRRMPTVYLYLEVVLHASAPRHAEGLQGDLHILVDSPNSTKWDCDVTVPFDV